MIRCLLLVLCLGAVVLPGLERNENQMNFSFERNRKNKPKSPVPGWATTWLVARSPDKPIPFVLVGRPVEGELVLIQPEDDEMVDLLMKDETGAELFDYQGLQGSFKVDFGHYSGGYPRDKVLGRELYERGEPTWVLEIDEIADFRFAEEAELDNEKREAGGETKIYSGVLKGRLWVGDEVVTDIDKPCPIAIVQPSSQLKVREGEMPTMTFNNAHIDFKFTLELTGKQLGLAGVGAIECNISFSGYADIKKGTDALFEENLPKINLGPR